MNRRLPGLAMAGALLTACRSPTPSTSIAPIGATIGYEAAVARISARQAIEDTVAIKGLGSILMTHGNRTPRVYVLLHGFTDVPTQFATVGRDLFADGDNVYIPLLPHHGERVAPIRALGRLHADELVAFGDSTVDIARGLGDSVIVVGLSAGGAITGWIAQSRPDVRRAVLIAPAISAGRVSEDETLALTMLASRLPDVRRTGAPLDSTTPEYVHGVSTRGLAEILRLGHRVREAAGKKPAGVKDIVMLLNTRDHTVSEPAALDLAQRWYDRGSTVAVYRFPDSAHLPHNVMEAVARGGNPDVAFPVVEGLARGSDSPQVVDKLAVPCEGWRCTLVRWFRGLGT